MGRAGLTSDRVVEACLELADDSGFENLTISLAARHFGVRPASLYSHVKDLRDLKTRMALRALEELSARAAGELAGRSGADALAALGEVYRGYAHEHPGRFAAARFPLDTDTARASAGGYQSRLIASLLRAYDLPESEHVHAVRLLGSTFLGYVTLEQSGGFSHSEPGSDLSWRRVIDALDVTLRNWPPSPPTP
ncbi:TetR/AcrR family transcriptional regulator [Prauserella cavernicola]|uniref:WHG domain-containing protein n=1 Tax=Prauserella cavernicola TaxID=2800127 RepID=A0A934V5E5_9PSEU|nr:TetR/AcrR family transcriptional regulator [Prauserella cavernicola]MBK1789386.1 WHG domain-containing protein [Prauserella cavernicola]